MKSYKILPGVLLLFTLSVSPVYAQHRSDFYDYQANRNWGSMYSRYLDSDAGQVDFVFHPSNPANCNDPAFISLTPKQGGGGNLLQFIDYWIPGFIFATVYNFMERLQKDNDSYGLEREGQLASRLSTCSGNACIEASHFTTVGQKVFAGIRDLDQAFIGAGVRYLEEGIFRDCVNLRYVKFGPDVVSLDQDVLLNCPKLEVVEFEFAPPEHRNISLMFNTSYDRTSLSEYPHMKAFVVPDGTEDSWKDLLRRFVFLGLYSPNTPVRVMSRTEFYSSYVSGVALSSSSVQLPYGSSHQLSAAVSPSSAWNRNVTWSSSDPSVATVSQTGLVTAISPGTASITAVTAEGGFSSSCLVTCPHPAVSIRLNTSSFRLAIDSSSLFSAAVSPLVAFTKDVIWSSSNPSVATVSSTGEVRGISRGQVFIKAHPSNYPDAVDSCLVTVLDGDAALSNLAVSAGTLQPAFSSSVANYTVLIPYLSDDVYFTSTPRSAHASVRGAEKLTPRLGDNFVDFTVVSEFGYEKTYTVNVHRQSNDGSLQSLTVNGTVLPPAVSAHADTVPGSVSSVPVIAVPAHPLAFVTVSGADSLQFGNNLITVSILSEDLTVRTGYTVNVYRQSNDALVKSLTVYRTGLPRGIFTNSVIVPGSVSLAPVIVDPPHPLASVTVSGADIPLLYGNNPNIVVTVVSEDGTATCVYYINVYRLSDNDATLQSLTVNGNSLPCEVLTHSMTVPGSTLSVPVTAIASHPSASVSVSGAGSPLQYGDNPISITVEITGADGTSTASVYSINVYRQSDDASLKFFTVNGTALPLDASVRSITVPGSVRSVPVVALPDHPLASVTVSGAGSPLQYGDNLITVTAVSEDRTTRVYTANVYRQSDNATLESLTVNGENLSPDVLTHNITVPGTTLSVPVIAFPACSLASVAVSGAGSPLQYGDNLITVTAVSEDRTATCVYTVNVHRQSDDATLKSLALNNGDIPFGFDAATFGYAITVPNAVSVITVDAEPNYPLSTVSGRGEYQLSAGNNTPVTVAVAAENAAFTEIYTLTVRRRSNDATLKSLTLNNGDDIPFGFDPAVFYYMVTVPYSEASIKVEAEANHESAAISGTGIYGLTRSHNFIKIEVTSEDGAVKFYTVTVVCTGSDASLQSLSLNNGAIPLQFQPDSFNYRVEVEDEVTDITVDCVTNHPEAIVSGDGFHPLEYGENVFPVTVIAEDYKTGERTTLVYTVTVYRISHDATLKSLTALPAELEPAFSPDITRYTAIVPYTVTSITIALETGYPLATCRISNRGATGQPGIKYLNVGENIFDIEVFAENKNYGKNYRVGITREVYKREEATGFDYRRLKPAIKGIDGGIEIDSPVAERVNIYSVTGMLLYSFDKPAGTFTLSPLRPFAPSTFRPSPVLIVKGSSGWSGKLVVND